MIETQSDDLKTYFDYNFQEIRGELTKHSKLLYSMNTKLMRLTEIIEKIYCIEDINSRFSDEGSLQDSTGANPKEIINDFLQTEVDRRIFNKINDDPQNAKRQTPSFGHINGYLGNLKENNDFDNQYSSKNERMVREDEEIIIETEDTKGINNIFSPNQYNTNDKQLIIEPIDIDLQESASKPTTPSNNYRKKDEYNCQIKNVLIATSKNDKINPKEIKRIQFKLKQNTSMAKEKLFENLRNSSQVEIGRASCRERVYGLV